MPDGAWARSASTRHRPSASRPRSVAASTSGRGSIAPAGRRPGEAGVPEHHGRGHDALREQPLFAVQVDQDGVEQLGALGESDLQRRPRGGVDEQRHRIEPPRPGPLARPGVGDAVVGEESPDVAVGAAQVAGGDPDDGLRDTLPGRPQRAVRHRRPRRSGGSLDQRRLRQRAGVVPEDGHAHHPGPGTAGGRACAGTRRWPPDWPASCIAATSSLPAVRPSGSNRLARRASASLALTGGCS